jgi:hypothetical protein
VEVLSLQLNDIERFPETCYKGSVSLFPELLSLDLSRNRIFDLPIVNVCLPSLQYLNLQWNYVYYRWKYISANPFAAFTTLTDLDLKHTNYTNY